MIRRAFHQLHDSLQTDVLREVRQISRTRDQRSRTRESDMPLGLTDTPMPDAPEPMEAA